jgi:ATP-dependent Clp protease ATP-binding subunit ClpA
LINVEVNPHLTLTFKRHTPSSRRAVYYAREAALHAGNSDIGSVHILAGLLAEEDSRVNRLFQLQDRFPEEAARIQALKKFPEAKYIPLARDGKRIVAYAAEEANHLSDYWIDAEYLVLGILRERSCVGAAMLNKTGLQIADARCVVVAQRDSRENYGPAPELWWLEKPITPFGRRAGLLYLVGIVCLIEILTQRGCGISSFLRK